MTIAGRWKQAPSIARHTWPGSLVWALWLALILAAPGCRHLADRIAPGEDEDEWVATPPIPRAPRDDPAGEIEAVEDTGQDGDLASGEPAGPDPAVLARMAFETGVQAAAQDDWETAERRFAEAVEHDPDSKWALYNLGLMRERLGNESGALESWRRAMAIDSGFSPAVANMARLMVRQGDARRAERMLRDLINAYPADLDLRNELALVMVAQGTPGKLEAAFAEARAVLSVDEQNIGALLVLGQVFYRQEKHELAEWVIDRVLALDDENATAHHLMGFLHTRQGNRREAFLSFQAAAEVGGEQAEVYVNYGALLNQAQDFEAAVEQLERAVSLAPLMPEARLNLGNAYRGEGRYHEALEQYRRVRRLDPRNADAVMNMALVYLDAHLDDIEALARLERAKELFEEYASAGGDDDRLDDFMRDTERAIVVEQRRVEREALRMAREAELEHTRRTEEEEARRALEEEAARRAERDAAERRRLEEERRAEEAARARRAAAEEHRARIAEQERERASKEERSTLDGGQGDRREAADDHAAPVAGTRLGDDEADEGEDEDEDADEDEGDRSVVGTRLWDDEEDHGTSDEAPPVEENEAARQGTILWEDD